MPIVGGIFNIVVGILILSVLLFFGIGSMIESIKAGIFHFDLSLLFMFVPGITIAALAIIGGIFAIKRKRWTWALAGSIAAAFVPIPFGVAAIVLLALSKNEFK